MTDEERRAKHAAHTREYVAANPEKAKAATARWRAANREQVAAYARAYREANLERMRAKDAARDLEEARSRARSRYASDPQRFRAQSDAWRRANPDGVKAQVHKRRARKQKAGGNMTAAEIRALKESADGICAYCLQPAAKLHVEHCTPLCRGGTNTLDNCVMACASCNARKGQKTVLEFLFNYPKLGAPA